MATKKQKREAAAEKREKFLAEVQADGLKAQQWDRKRREAKAAKAKLTEDEKTKRETTTEALAKLLPKESAA
jgi:hypothetical protein